MVLYIRNMACESCKILVREELEKMGFSVIRVELGIAETKKAMTQKQQAQLANNIKKAGLELVKSKDDVLIDQVKAAIAEYIDNSSRIKTNLSDHLSRKLNYDYAYISSYFSAMQSSTVEQFMISLKIEKVKELLMLHDMTLTQIAYKFNYSSVAHLSHQFKKVAGISATAFKPRKTAKGKPCRICNFRYIFYLTLCYSRHVVVFIDTAVFLETY